MYYTNPSTFIHMFMPEYSPRPLPSYTSYSSQSSQGNMNLIVGIVLAVLVVYAVSSPQRHGQWSDYRPMVSQCARGMKASVTRALKSITSTKKLTTVEQVKSTEYVLAKLDTCVHCKTAEERLKSNGISYKTCSPGVMNVMLVPTLFKWGEEIPLASVIKSQPSHAAQETYENESGNDSDEE